MNAERSKLVFFDRSMLAARDFWINSLAREVDAVTLPLDYPRPHIHRGNTDTLSFEIPEAVCQHLNRLSGEKPFLTYAVCLAAVKIALHKLTRGTVIVVGSPVRADGPGGNVLPIVSDIDPTVSFREFLVQLRQTLLDAYANQQYPFASLVRDFSLDRVDNKCPLFDVALALTDYHGELPPVKNDISIRLTRQGSHMLGRIEFNADLYKTQSIERLAQASVTLLASALRDTNTKIRDLDILTPAERFLVLQEWNHASVDFPPYACFHHMFAAQAERTPDALAVIFAGRALTYRQLDRHANQLARHLQSLGVGPEVLVGLCVEPSLERVIGMLGILKAGGAFLPLDPDYPTERLSFMLDDAQAPVLVTTAALGSRYFAYSLVALVLGYILFRNYHRRMKRKAQQKMDLLHFEKEKEYMKPR